MSQEVASESKPEQYSTLQGAASYLKKTGTQAFPHVEMLCPSKLIQNTNEKECGLVLVYVIRVIDLWSYF